MILAELILSRNHSQRLTEGSDGLESIPSAIYPPGVHSKNHLYICQNSFRERSGWKASKCRCSLNFSQTVGVVYMFIAHRIHGA